jgi:Lon protease-like protein
MAAESLLPLFALPVVLFPGAKLPLHIFEQRYRMMVGRAAETKSEFGVILMQDGKLAEAGCTAVVQQITQHYGDGRFDVETIGRRRFRVLGLDETLPYTQAQVEYFEDEAAEVPDKTEIEKLNRLAQQIASDISTPITSADPSQAQPSFHLASVLPLDLSFKQGLLTARSENDRLRELSTHLATLATRVAQARRAQKLAGTNGRSH